MVKKLIQLFLKTLIFAYLQRHQLWKFEVVKKLYNLLPDQQIIHGKMCQNVKTRASKLFIEVQIESISTLVKYKLLIFKESNLFLLSLFSIFIAF